MPARMRRNTDLTVRQLAGEMRQRATVAQDAKRFQEAATLYRELVGLNPADSGLRIQLGHMLKESGDLAGAETEYLTAQKDRPLDADLALQLGHLYKTAGRLADAETAYRQALTLKPGWAVPEHELAHVYKSGWRGGDRSKAGAVHVPDTALVDTVDPLALDPEHALLRAGHVEKLLPALAPLTPASMLYAHSDHVEVRRLGRMEPSYWGEIRTLRGVEAIRGFCISETPIVELQIVMNGLTIHRGPVQGGHVLPYELEKDRARKYVFNVWLDFATFAQGRFAIELRLIDMLGERHSAHDHVWVAEAWPESRYPQSDALIALPADDPRPVDEQVNARPSIVRQAERSLFATPPKAILVQRTDQLGDMIASIPALKRLRQLFPDARIVGLLTAANEAFAHTLRLFDEIIVIDFPDDRFERRRTMPLAAQEALREQLASYDFDIALDLAQSHVSRTLLRLSGAPFLLGVGDASFPWLTAGFDFNTHDPMNGLDVIPHSAKVLAMIESLGAVLGSKASVIRRDDLDPSQLERYGILPGEPYVVLHAGARVVFSRWPRYPELARLVLARTSCKVVMLTEDAGIRATIPADLLASPRFLFLDQRLPFDDFDAIISFCTAMVGNDSGPKHLASLRGVNIVTLFTNRINALEWGQEITGKIMSRKVPCAGCLIFHDEDECGKDHVCIKGIRTEEVFAEIRPYLDAAGTLRAEDQPA